jgi:hypothetical protein
MIERGIVWREYRRDNKKFTDYTRRMNLVARGLLSTPATLKDTRATLLP